MIAIVLRTFVNVAFGVLVAVAVSPASVAQTPATQSALVRTQPVASGTLYDTITAYGQVKPDPESTLNVTVPRNGQIARLYVRIGMAVTKSSPLLDLDTDPGALAGFEQARAATNFAQADLARVRDLRSQGLATNQQVAAAEKTLQDAEASLKAQRMLGTERGRETIAAKFRGIVTDIRVRVGDRISAGMPTISIAPTASKAVLLGIEPADARKVRPGLRVVLSSVFERGRTIEAKIASVNGVIDPQTQLVPAWVVIRGSNAERFTIGTRMVGVVHLAEVHGLVVPRQAVLSDSGGAYVFTVKDGRAHRIAVTVSLEAQGRAVVTGDLSVGDRLVVAGNHELRNGMAVREEGR